MTDSPCPSCRADPNAAPGRWCPSRACVCNHPDCPAYLTSRRALGTLPEQADIPVGQPFSARMGERSQTCETPAKAATDRGRDHRPKENR